jgi:hypothetical protein
VSVLDMGCPCCVVGEHWCGTFPHCWGNKIHRGTRSRPLGTVRWRRLCKQLLQDMRQRCFKLPDATNRRTHTRAATSTQSQTRAEDQQAPTAKHSCTGIRQQSGPSTQSQVSLAGDSCLARTPTTANQHRSSKAWRLPAARSDTHARSSAATATAAQQLQRSQR